MVKQVMPGKALLKIGPVEVSPGLALAPMAGVTDHPFRLLAKRQGCPLLYSEMISAKGLLYNNRRHHNLLYYSEEERPIGFQLFGSDPQILARAAFRLEEHGGDFIDLNLGCPTPKITRNGEGGALLRNPGLCSEIFKAVAGAVSCPVTVKLRKGWDQASVNAVEIARRAEEAGIKAVTVHGRTVDQGYSGNADWDIIRQVKEALVIPVIGNGDVDSAEKAVEMLSYCDCDGIMIGRAARGNPWIFSSTLSLLQKGKPAVPPSPDQVIHMALRHLALLCQFKGEPAAVKEMRQHAACYIRGFPGAASARQKLIRASSYEAMEEVLYAYSRSLKEH